VDAWCTALPPVDPGPGSRREALTALNRALAGELAAWFGHDRLSEAAVAYRLLRDIPPGATLVAGNSLSIRLLDLVGGNLPGPGRLIANRGASGIEGLVATAAGCLLADRAPTTLLLGDTSLLYDLNGLALLRELPAPLIIVVLNNDGGGIFHLLPVPDPHLLQEHYQRPHGYRFEAACALFGLDYQAPETLPAFSRAYRQALVGERSCLIEITCDARDTVRELRALTQNTPAGQDRHPPTEVA
jgi:2-succinyl-5-enolpyruvyl-6-hydroxy-3-cyclohexene-1-carboxylate synthase